jgi:hypothetical protein
VTNALEIKRIKMMQKPYLRAFPDANGYFGKFGGAFLPPELVEQFKKLALGPIDADATQLTEKQKKLFDEHQKAEEIRAQVDAAIAREESAKYDNTYGNEAWRAAKVVGKEKTADADKSSGEVKPYAYYWAQSRLVERLDTPHKHVGTVTPPEKEVSKGKLN